MTLAEFAHLVGADPKWVLNAGAVLGRRRYSLPDARRLAVARALQEGPGVPLPRAYALAGEALAGYSGDPAPVALGEDSAGAARVQIDLYRILAAVNARVAHMRAVGAPRGRGRPPRLRRGSLRAAAAHGLDLSLLAANLRRTPAERLRQLDAMADFRQRVRRIDPA